jgi:hypothetical protein
MHYQKAAESYGGIGEYMTKTKTYKSGNMNKFNEIYIGKLTERKCITKKQHLHHWALKGISNEFIVCCKNQWDPHPTNITDLDTVKQNYVILVESERGPMVVEH